MDTYWPRVIRFKKEVKEDEREKIKREIVRYILSVKNEEKKKMLESVYFNNLEFAKTKDEIELLFEIIRAMDKIDRKYFVLNKEMAYFDMALPIIENQTISQPSTVARMLLLLFKDIKEKNDIKVYEVGLGSGWNAALMKYILKLYKKKGEVYSVDRIKKVVEFARKNLKKVKIKIHTACEDGFVFVRNKKFDYIIFTAGIPDLEIEKEVEKMAKKNLKKKGRLVAPETFGKIIVYEKQDGIKIEKTLEEYSFVPIFRGKIL
jgi:protein-L-isoaspartate(D-aspartate) O-methyltransferase